MLGKIWNRNLFFQGIKHFLFFFILILFFYVFIDFFIHNSKMTKATNLELISYYFSQIILSFEIFLPLSFLLTIIKVFSSLTLHKESIAYQTAGLSKMRLMSPFFLIALFICLFTLFSEQFLVPFGASISHKIQEKYLFKSLNKQNIHSIKLPDKSELVYQTYDAQKNVLSDVFWIISFKEIWHIETLTLENIKIGLSVDRFIRDQDHLLKKVASFKRYPFQTMNFTKIELEDNFISYEDRALSKLFSQHLFASKEEKIKIKTQLHKKIALSFLPMLILFCVAPFCLQFSRNFSPFLIAGVSLFSFAFFFALFNGFLLLSESQALSPFIGVWFFPFCLLLLAFFKTSRSL